MSRTTYSMVRWISLLAGMACLLAGHAWGAPLVATPYSVPKRTIKIAVLLLQSQKGGSPPTTPYWNPDPWILPVLNHSPFKPIGWELENPLAPGTLQNDTELNTSGDVYAEDGKGGNMKVRGTKPYLTNWYTNGKAFDSQLTKNDPAYWVVKLDQKSLDALAEFDLLIVNGHSKSTLTAVDKNYLRILLDRGATIWLNNSQRDGNQLTNFFLDPPISLNPGLYNDTNNNVRLVNANPTSWLLDGIYKLNDAEINNLRDNLSEKSFIMGGVAGYSAGAGSLVQEVVRLYSTNNPYPDDGKPAIAAGRVGNGFLIVTGGDIIGGTADWWERRHNNSLSDNKLTFSDLDIWPYAPAMSMSTERPNKHYTYVACSKFIFNMLARPASWHMIGGDTYASRFYPQNFAASLSPGWTVPFTVLNDPVSYGKYVAVSGLNSQLENEIRVYRTRSLREDGGIVLDYPYGLYDEQGRQLTPNWFTRPDWWTNKYPYDAGTEMDTCFFRTAPTGGHWVGSPVFGTTTRTINGKRVTSTVLYALLSDATGVTPYCFTIDPYVSTTAFTELAADTQAGGILWKGSYAITTGTTRASMTFSNGRLVVTSFGQTTDTDQYRVFLYDGATGKLCAAVGSSPEWTGQFRLTGPASLVTAQVDILASPSEAGDASGGMSATTSSSIGSQGHRLEVMEFLAVTGEYFSKGSTATTGQPALFLIPPVVAVKLGNDRPAIASIPPDLTLTTYSGNPQAKLASYRIGDPMNTFRRKYVVAMKASGKVLKITLRNWSVFFPQGSAQPVLTPKLGLSYTPLVLTVAPVAATGAQRATTASPQSLTGVPLYMGYPIILRGSQHYNLNNRLSFRLSDGDAETSFGYTVDTPPAVQSDKIYVNTNSGAKSGLPTLKDSLDPQPSAQDLAIGGTLTAYRLTHPEFSYSTLPDGASWEGEIAYQFYGDTFGPKRSKDLNVAEYDAQYTANGLDNTWRGDLPWLWRSDFPYPAALGRDAAYTVATYNGYGALTGTADGYKGLPLTLQRNRAMLYALDPEPSRYLQQVVTAGSIVQTPAPAAEFNPARTLTVKPSELDGALRVGARAILQQADFTWDLGTIVKIRQADATTYWVVFDREAPGGQAAVGASLLVATSTPYVSHVQAWDTVTGAEPLREYDIVGGTTATRLSEGICGTYPADLPGANPDPAAGQRELMISFTELAKTCHQPDELAGTTVRPLEAASFAADNSLSYLYLPRTPFKAANNKVTGEVDQNFTVDYRTGRVALSPAQSGEFADRFVVVHYYTNDLVNNKSTWVQHAEIMHVPSQIKWQYQFADAVPDGGPVVVNDTIYLPAVRNVGTYAMPQWQPTLYAFATNPANTQDVRPLWMQSIGPVIADTKLPYRVMTTPTPTPGGILIGTAIPGGESALYLLSDRGLLIADGHRLLRVDGDGLVTWQASATVDADPAALASNNPAVQGAGVVQQDFTLITRIRRQANGNILVCDTGGNRVVEMNRQGTVVWQFPDSDMTYLDPDLLSTGGAVENLAGIRKPTVLRLNGPRDVQRYSRDISVPSVTWSGNDLGSALVRWETTMIADAGSNRIIEVYRPLVKIDNPGSAVALGIGLELASGFQYRPDFKVGNTSLIQFAAVIADGRAIGYNGEIFNQPLSFVTATRCEGPDGLMGVDQLDSVESVKSYVRTREILAAVGNPVADPNKPGSFLRTVRLSVDWSDLANPRALIRNYATLTGAGDVGVKVLQVDYAAEFMPGDDVAIKDGVSPQAESLGVVTAVDTQLNKITVTIGLSKAYPVGSVLLRKRVNALAVRANQAYDYTLVRQLDTVKLWNPNAGQYEVHALVVDQSGVREVPLRPDWQSSPVFEMAQAQYANALNNGTSLAKWDKLRARLGLALDSPEWLRFTAWRKDYLFAPVAVQRLDSGSGYTTDQAKARYLISQMNTIAHTDPNTWINNQDDFPEAMRRIHLFEARYLGAAEGWGIIDSSLNYYVYPDPLSADFPNLPGTTYPLTQPLSIDRD